MKSTYFTIIDNKLNGFSSYIKDPSEPRYHKAGAKQGGQVSKAQLGGVYDTFIDRKKYKVLFKQGRNDGETISEFIASKFYACILPGYGASVFLAKKDRATNTKALVTSDLHPEVYIGTVFYDEFEEIFKLMAFKDRPLFLQTRYAKKSHQFIMQQHDTNLGEVLAVSLWLGDYDTHIANLGLANIAGQKQYVKIDHGWSFAQIQDFMDYKSVPWHGLDGFGKPTNHFSDYDHDGFLKNPNGNFCKKIKQLKQIRKEYIKSILEYCFTELDNYYTTAAYLSFAKWIGYPHLHVVGKEQLISYLTEKLYTRAINGIKPTRGGKSYFYT